MTTRSRLDEIEDFDFAVDNYIHKGKTEDEVTELLRQRGADEEQIARVFETIGENYQGARLLESGKIIRACNFVIDFSIICVLWYFTYNILHSVGRKSNNLLILLLPPLTYFIFFESYLGQTPGKIVTGTIVVDKNGKLPGLLKVFIRTAVRFYPDTLFTAFFQDRILHDKISSTYVVNKRRWTSKYEIT